MVRVRVRRGEGRGGELVGSSWCGGSGVMGTIHTECKADYNTRCGA
jgi:hypothetical protein